MSRIAVSMGFVFIVAGSTLAMAAERIGSSKHVGLHMDEPLTPLKDVSSALQSTCSRNLAVD